MLLKIYRDRFNHLWGSCYSFGLKNKIDRILTLLFLKMEIKVKKIIHFKENFHGKLNDIYLMLPDYIYECL